MALKFCPISSGSDGNSIYIGSEDVHILIDAGLSGKRISEGLENAVGIGCDKLDGIFITHEHTDHIQGAGIISRRYGTPLYATKKTWECIDRRNLIGKVDEDRKHIINSGEELGLKNIVIEAFDIPHDAAQPVGYCVYLEDKKITVATDIGCVTDNVREKLFGSDIILLESNHDLEMLKNGSYPAILKKRIMGDKGHLSNRSAGELLADIICPKLKYVFLGHLSAENNMPLIAMETVATILDANHIKVGRDFHLYLAQRGSVSDSLIL
ncbi:MAG: MBL fold metallo-hydrolase [Defluviitaleaceae bacterium]|nr:MBL fold metallo-hydrolase [Defluviitaleaceae bacterium]